MTVLDILVDDYVAIRYEDGTRSTVIGKVARILPTHEGMEYVVTDGSRIVGAFRGERLIVTGIRQGQAELSK